VFALLSLLFRILSRLIARSSRYVAEVPKTHAADFGRAKNVDRDIEMPLYKGGCGTAKVIRNIQNFCTLRCN